MGVLIVAESPPAGSPYDKWICYRADTQGGSYTKQNGDTGQAITDLTYYDTSGTSLKWYKISYYATAGGTESAQSDAMQGLSETYTSVKKVQNFLRMSSITDSTSPSIQGIIELINRKEDEIDGRTGHAWRTRYSGTTSGLDQTAQYEYYDVWSEYEYHTGRPIYLKHRMIRDLSAAAGDALELWDGSNWIDWIATKTESRASDWWCDYARGILYIKAYYGVIKPLGLRIKYRYGEQTVNRVVEDIATKMVMVDVLLGESRAVILPEGTSNLTYQQKVDQLEKDIDDKIVGLKEFQVMSIQT